MNRLDLPYVLATAAVGIALFCAGYMVRPTPQKVACVEAPIVQARVEPIPPPPPPSTVVVAPITTVDRLPLYTAATGEPPLPPSLMEGSLLPVPPASVPVASAPRVAPVVTPVAAPKPAPSSPEPIVLEEIPDNPYKRAHR